MIQSHILLLEDDQALGELIHDQLIQRNYVVTWAQSLADLYEQTQNLKQKIDLALVDLNLPDGMGFSAIKNLNCPCIIMSALNTPEHRLKSAELGVEDFIPKPFLFKEMELKLKKLLQSGPTQFQIGFCNLDLSARTVENEKTKEVFFLSGREFVVIDVLIKKAPEVVSRDDILNAFDEDDETISHRSIDNIIVKLRHYIGDQNHQQIRSVRGVGYQWSQQTNSLNKNINKE